MALKESTAKRVRVSLLACVSAGLLLAGCAGGGGTGGSGDASPIVIGVSGPLSGEQAQYGRDWQAGFDIYLNEIADTGGPDGRPVEIKFEDSQNDPSQATTIAQRFVSDDSVLAVIGDFSSSTSTVASPLYQRGGMLQLGITNSAPFFTDTGDFIFSPSVTAEVDARLTTKLASELGSKIGLVYTNTDFGRSFADIVEAEASGFGAEIVASTGVDESSTDYMPVLLQLRDSGSDVVIFATYYRTTSLLVQQAHEVGLKGSIVAMGANYSKEFLDLAGPAAEGVHLLTPFFAGNSREDVVSFVTAFEAKNGAQPNQFNATAYDGIRQIVWACGQSDCTRTGIRDALRDGKDIPSIVLGPFSYNENRRIQLDSLTHLIVTDGEFVLAE